MKGVLAQVEEWVGRGEDVAIATVVAVKRSAGSIGRPTSC